MKSVLSLVLLLSVVSSHATKNDAMKRVKAKFLVNYEAMCIKGIKTHKLDQETHVQKCACQVKQFDENLTGDEIIRLFSSSDKYLYPKLRSKANNLIKQCG